MNRHDFQLAARSFRAGRISLSEFTEKVFADIAASAPADSRPASGDEALKSADEFGKFIRLPQRSPNAHKGDCGHVLVIAGSHEMPGAAALTGLAALRGGAGLVTVATCSSARQTVLNLSPCLMTVDLGASLDDSRLPQDIHFQNALKGASVVALGPGLGQSDAAKHVTAWLYETLAVPMVIDADSLNCLAATKTDLSEHAGPRILTPHPGEFRRLYDAFGGVQTAQLFSRAAQQTAAKKIAAENQIVIVLKGAGTIITDGQRELRNPTGNPGLATAGTGDVLSGVIAALIGQGVDPFYAAATGCALHGLAGDIARHQRGLCSMIATDVIEALGHAFAQLVR